MMNYVNGFCFNADGSRVVLIRKLKPEWQKGLLNGVGGKLEEPETAHAAMVREFEEETGVKTATTDWRCRIDMVGDAWWMGIFSCFNDDIYEAAKTTEAEEIVKIFPGALYHEKVIPNLTWIIPFMLDKDLTAMQTIDYRSPRFQFNQPNNPSRSTIQ